MAWPACTASVWRRELNGKRRSRYCARRDSFPGGAVRDTERLRATARVPATAFRSLSITSTCLFADGAGAAVVTAQDAIGGSVGPVLLQTDAAGAELISLADGPRACATPPDPAV